MKLIDYVVQNTERGECKCGQCIDRGNRPDPEGHTVDMVFFKVIKRNGATAEQFRRLTDEHKGEFANVNPFDGGIVVQFENPQGRDPA